MACEGRPGFFLSKVRIAFENLGMLSLSYVNTTVFLKWMDLDGYSVRVIFLWSEDIE